MSELVINVSSQSRVPVETPAADPIKAFVGGALSLDPALDAHWDIIDVYPDNEEETPLLALAHYNDSFDPTNRFHAPLSKVRGSIVDLKTGAIVASSYGYTATLPCNSPLEEKFAPDAPKGILVMDTEIHKYLNSYETAPEETVKVGLGIREFDRQNIKLMLGYEGTMVRIFKWNDRVFFSTHKRIDALESNWGGRMRFSQLWEKLNGPDIRTFFGNELYSPYCYIFLIVDNEVRLASSTRDNRIVFIGVKRVWSEESYAQKNGPYYWPEELELVIPTPEPDSSAFSKNLNHSLVIQTEVDVATANKFLFPNQYATPIPANVDYDAKDHEMVIEYAADGRKVNNVYFKRLQQKVVDDRLAGGDFLIAYVQDAAGDTTVYRIESPAFIHRVEITGNNPNMYNRFAVEMVNFTKAEPHELLNEYPKYIGSDGKTISLKDPKDRMVYWWSLFYDAIAPAYKDEVDGYFSRYEKDIQNVARFILGEYRRVSDPEELKRISDQTRRRMDDLLAISSSVRDRNTSPQVVMRNLLYNETGPSFYRMITTVKNLEKLRSQKKLASSTAEQVLASSQ